MYVRYSTRKHGQLIRLTWILYYFPNNSKIRTCIINEILYPASVITFFLSFENHVSKRKHKKLCSIYEYTIYSPHFLVKTFYSLSYLFLIFSRFFCFFVHLCRVFLFEVSHVPGKRTLYFIHREVYKFHENRFRRTIINSKFDLKSFIIIEFLAHKTRNPKAFKTVRSTEKRKATKLNPIPISSLLLVYFSLLAVIHRRNDISFWAAFTYREMLSICTNEKTK